MDRARAGLPGGRENGLDVQVALRRSGWPDQDRFVREPRRKGLDIRFRVDGHALDPHFLQRPENANRDLTTVGDENFFEHRDREPRDAHDAARIEKSVCPTRTVSPSTPRISTTSPATGALILE